MKKIRKYSILTILIFLFIANLNTYVYGDFKDEFIRVGLEASYKQVQTLQIKNNEIHINMSIGGEIMNYGTVYSNLGFTVSPSNAYYVELGNSYNDFDTAYSMAKSFINGGNIAVCSLIDNKWTVLLGGFDNEYDARKAMDLMGGNRLIYPNNKAIMLDDGLNRIAVFLDENAYPLFSSNKEMDLGTIKYRGYLEVNRKKGALLDVVNVLGIEDYLKSVVPSEMPQAWHIEALKAQTVAARSYTYTRMGIHSDAGYDMCDKEHCQIYKGFTNEADKTSLAVDATRGLVAYYNNEIINATFSSSSGGATDSSENVWNNKIEYLRGVNDQYDLTGKVWTRSFSLSEIDSLLGLNNVNIGNTQSVSISEVNASGRVQKLTINGSAGVKVLEKEDVRTFFSKSKGGSLESRLFVMGDMQFTQTNAMTSSSTEIYTVSNDSTVKKSVSDIYIIDKNGNVVKNTGDIYVITSTGTTRFGTVAGNTSISSSIATSIGNTVTFSGKGYGHGVGLSQHGAKGMAEAGFTYDAILKHYYQGIEIK